MKHKTQRLIAIVTALVMVADSFAMPLCCSQPDFKATIIRQPVKQIRLPNSMDLFKSNKPTKPTIQPKPKIETPQPIRRLFRVTAYTAIDSGQRGDGITASGVKATPYYTMAASKEYPFGTILEDVKTHERYAVQDRGGAIKGNKLDLYVGHSNLREADRFGVQCREYYIIFPKEGK